MDSIAAKDGLRELEFRLQAHMREQELRLVIKLGGMIMALGGILIAIKYFG